MENAHESAPLRAVAPPRTAETDAGECNGLSSSSAVSAFKELPNGSSDGALADERGVRERLDMCAFVAQCAASLMLDQASTLTAIVLAQKFFSQRRKVISCTFSQFDARIIAGACLFISTKSCEVPRTLRSVANVVHAVANDTDEPLGTGSRYANLKMSLINAEQTVLRVLGFEVDAAMPFSFLFGYAHQHEFSASTVQCALKLATDVHFDASALALPASVVAAASLRLASVILLEEQHASDAEKWWYLYDTSDEDIACVARILRRVYAFTDALQTKRRVDPSTPSASITPSSQQAQAAARRPAA